MDNPSRRPGTRILKLVFAFGGTAVILLLAFKYLSADILLSSLQNLRPIPLSAALGAYVGITAMRAARFTILGRQLGYSNAFAVASVHAALLRVMPLRSGELAYGIMIRRMGRGGFGEGMAAIAVLRLLDLAVLLVIAAVGVGVRFSALEQYHTTVIVGVAAAAAVSLFFALTPIVRALKPRFGTPPEAGKPPIRFRLLAAMQSATQISLKRRAALLMCTFAIWLLMPLWFYLLMLSSGMTIGVLDGFASTVFGLIGSILPLSLIGSFGPMEGGFAFGLTAVGFSPEAAASHAVIISTLALVDNWLVAIPGWFWILSRSRKKQ